ncbi:MAG: hypothetical protein WC998_05105 [Candidatus Paceibacterota bacterium]|jgi:hypothetical protein
MDELEDTKNQGTENQNETVETGSELNEETLSTSGLATKEKSSVGDFKTISTISAPAYELRTTLNHLSNKVTELISLQPKVVPPGDFYSNARKALSDRVSLLKESIQFTLEELGRTTIQ